MRFVGGDGFWESATAAFSHPQPTLGEPRRRQERNIFAVFRDPKTYAMCHEAIRLHSQTGGRTPRGRSARE